MTLEEIKQYRALRAEIQRLDVALLDARRQSMRRDSVQGSMPNYPYTLHTVRIEGFAGESGEAERIRQLREQTRKAAADRLAEIEEFLRSLGDARMSLLLRMRFVEGRSYAYIVTHHPDFYGAAESSPRMAIQRFFK